MSHNKIFWIKYQKKICKSSRNPDADLLQPSTRFLHNISAVYTKYAKNQL